MDKSLKMSDVVSATLRQLKQNDTHTIWRRTSVLRQNALSVLRETND